ncbi:PEA2 [Candida pseudojiufengensis]|uniref:PEA2 n=1 Tax=Candida pseudojiufengensis TaxID=497109 RepID=UPI002224EB6E|nr:PEA2 [Candida pseudojiufengensis]KAI5964663.1 PEA2 [Candida pseudojiufengensis]
MIDNELFIRDSPFKQTHTDSSNNFNLSNTTSDLIKFQLQEQYRHSLTKVNENLSTTKGDDLNYNNHRISFQQPFHNHLQQKLDSNQISLNIPSLSSTPTSGSTDESDNDDEDDCSLDSFLSQTNPNVYLNLKVLIENSIFESTYVNKNSILSLNEVKILKNHIEDKEVIIGYLKSKILLSQQFINKVITNDTESSTLIRIIKTITSLQDQLILNTQDLDESRQKLNNHNLSCLLLGYIEDIKRSREEDQFEQPTISNTNSPGKISNSTLTSSPKKLQKSQKLIDSIFAHIANIAAQRGISLPSPSSSNSGEGEEEEVENKLKSIWLQECIDTILINTPSTKSSPTPDTTTHNESSFSKSTTTTTTEKPRDYKTAFNDLRFSYEYLAKEYELSKLSTSKLIQEYKKKLDKVERLKSIENLSTSTLTSPTKLSLESKEKEILKLRKELLALKIDKIGSNTISSSSSSNLISPNLDSNFSNNLSPMNSGSIFLSTGQSSTTRGSTTSNTGSTLSDEDDLNSIHSFNKPVSNSGGGVSNAMLRKEFKKIVSEMQDQYEFELTEERMRRQKLEEELESLKEKTKLD